MRVVLKIILRVMVYYNKLFACCEGIVYFCIDNTSSSDETEVQLPPDYLLPDFSAMHMDQSNTDIFSFNSRTIEAIWVDIAQLYISSHKNLVSDRCINSLLCIRFSYHHECVHDVITVSTCSREL